jgi:hypothetical protein
MQSGAGLHRNLIWRKTSAAGLILGPFNAKVPPMKSALLLSAAVLLATPCAMAGTVIPTGHFSSIELEAGGHVVLHHGAVQSVTLVKGSTQFTSVHMDASEPGKLVIKTCNESCPQQYDMELDIVTPDIGGVAISGGGEIEAATGFPAQHDVSAAVEGGGRIDLRTLDSDTAHAAVEGGGRIFVHADHRLNAAVEGGGQIIYSGNPQVTSAIDGGGQVKPGN